jgi:SAM-dependent methyltransferase
VPDYDLAAESYDATRGGEPRAAAAATAVLSLVPPRCTVVVDIGCGTGIVTKRLAAPGRRVYGVDMSGGMLGLAQTRLPGRVVQGDATRLPYATGSCDVVILLWVLHLLDRDTGHRVLDEAARILRADGILITTVGKNRAFFETDSDTTQVLDEVCPIPPDSQTDDARRLGRWAAGRGLDVTARTTFSGHGQGRSPQTWQAILDDLPWITAAGPDALTAIRRRLRELPDQDRPRSDPVYHVVALSRT